MARQRWCAALSGTLGSPWVSRAFARMTISLPIRGALCVPSITFCSRSPRRHAVVLDFNSDPRRHLGLATDWHLWQMCHCGIFGANRCPMYAPTVCADCHASHTLCSRAACSQCRQASSRAGSGQRGRAHARARATFCSAHFWAWPSRLPSCVRGAEKVVKLV